MIVRLLLCVWLVCSVGFVAAQEPWSTYRGNAARTGNTDRQPIPETLRVVWSVKSQDHFVASMVPIEKGLYSSALGAFNRPVLAVYPLDGKADAKPIWTRSAPYLRLASVSSPAVSGSRIVFGDGMHQDAGGVLHCLTADTGRPLWQLPMPGELNHLEGAPTISGGKVYMGAGAGGVLCVDLQKALLDGKEFSDAEILSMQNARWKELQAKYDAEKKKDPDFAIPPNEDQLHKPAPKILWKKGEQKWHVDAPVTVVGDRVLVATSFLDKENVGERALYCLNANTGETLWTAPLKFNPWGGASVVGETVIISGSSVGYYYTMLKGAKGDVSAFDLKTGEQKWRKEVPAGVVGCVALTDELAITTATDGKARAFAIADGERRWIYDAKVPIFAPPAISGELVVIGDLNSTVHVVGLHDGQARSKLDLGKDGPQTPGMIYGGPIIHGGNVYLATCNLEGPLARKPTCVVCLGK